MIAMLFYGPLSTAQIYSETDTVGIITVSGHPGDTIAVQFNLVNTFAVAAFLFRVTYDSLYFVPLSMHLTSRSQGFDMYGANFGVPGVVTMLGATMNPMHNAILPGRGTVASITVAIRDYATPGSYSIHFDQPDSTPPQNQLSNTAGDSLVIPVLTDGPVVVLQPQLAGEFPNTPGQFALAQNYPNPFNGCTQITFSLPVSENIVLSIFDLLGRKVIDLFSGPADAGKTEIIWDGRNSCGESMVSGVYFYRLETQRGQVVTNRMTLLK
jgi:hypothetical protein